MKTATVRELRNNYTALLSLIHAGEEIAITQRGKRIARLIPDPEEVSGKVDWTTAPEVTRDRTNSRTLSAEESSYILHEASGKW